MQISTGQISRVANISAAIALAFIPTFLPADELSRAEAEALLRKEWKALVAKRSPESEKLIDSKSVVLGDMRMPFTEKRFGQEPENGHSLWISMHGGGGGPKQMNDRQWHNQARLYQLDEGYYICPRAPTDTWNLWHQKHIDPMFDQLIAAYLIARGVNPDRVYIMGYSAGGDGVYQLAPRISDRLAAAAMMAGHPNETKPDGLRNLPFALYVGAKDHPYKRNKVAAEWKTLLETLQAADPEGYPHRVRIPEQYAHWMNGYDREALPWMAKFSRTAWPKKIIWLQDDVTHTRYYWLSVPSEQAAKGHRIEAEFSGQTIAILSEDVTALSLRLNDAFINLDEPIRVTANGKIVFDGKVTRTAKVIRDSLEERADPSTACTAILPIKW